MTNTRPAVATRYILAGMTLIGFGCAAQVEGSDKASARTGLTGGDDGDASGSGSDSGSGGTTGAATSGSSSSGNTTTSGTTTSGTSTSGTSTSSSSAASSSSTTTSASAGGAASSGTMASTGTGGSATSGAGGSGGTSGTGGSGSEPTDSILYDFEAADAASGWEPLGGNWQVMADPDDASNSVYAQVDAGAGKVWLVGGDASWTNFEIEARVKLLEAGGYVFIGGRFESEAAYYYMYLRDNGKVRVRAFIGGSTSELGSAATDTFTDIEPGAWHTIKLSLQGSTLQAFFANVPAGAAVTHSALSAGGIVLGAQDAAVAFDDVTVTLY